MPESDDEYIQPISDDDLDAHRVSRKKGKGPRAKGSATRGGGGFEVSRTWENVVEGADGTISGAIEGLLEAGKRKRLLKDTTPVQRGIFRHLIVVLDLSNAMIEKDLRPTRHLLTIRYAKEFVVEFFEQNPISQLGFIGMRDGVAMRISDLSGNPLDHIAALETLPEQDPKGFVSLQNALNMAHGALYHVPSHGTREILIIMGAIFTVDPEDIFKTIEALVSSKIKCTIIGIAAEVQICNTIVSRTNPLPDRSSYGVALNEQHYRELFMAATTPPITPGSNTDPSIVPTTTSSSDRHSAPSSLLMMGFPSRAPEPAPSLCACHSRPSRGGFACPRCASKVCALPTTCPVCGLTLILSTHLARSYHHLFPLRAWAEVSWRRVAERTPLQPACFSCLARFPEIPPEEARAGKGDGRGNAGKVEKKKREGGVSESGRYECESCGTFYCIDCDVFAHEVLHNCAGCLSGRGTGGGTGADVVMQDVDTMNGG